MLNHCPKPFIPWLALSAFGGLRGVEIYGREEDVNTGLHWEDFNWDAQVIALNGYTAKKTSNRGGAKVGKPRIIPIDEALKDWLLPWRDARGPVHTPSRDPSYGNPSIVDKLGAKIGGWRKNALRSSRASYRMAIAKDYTVVTLEMGHTQDVFSTNYHNPRLEIDAVEWFSLTRAKVKELNS